MICPHCHKDISDKEVARHIARKGGGKSKRTITPDQQRMMQSAKRSKAIEWRAKNKEGSKP